MRRFDAIVVGARCAGSPVALWLARHGRRVLVVDKARFPSDTLSSHLLTPRGSSYLGQLGLLEAVLQTTPSFDAMRADIEGIVLSGMVSSEALKGRYLRLHGRELERPVRKWISVRRRVLDKILVDAASAAGAEVREQVRVEALLHEGDRVVGIRTRTGQGQVIEERADVVIGADGRHSFVAEALKLPRLHEQTTSSFCYWGYFSGFAIDEIGGPQIVQRGRLRTAIVPTHDGAFAVSVWGPGAWFRDFRANLERNFLRAAEYCSPGLSDLIRPAGRRTERLYGTADLANFCRPAHGPGWALVGDAAASHDQCTAIGMTHALRDAQLLGEELMAIQAPGATDAALSRYGARRDGDHLLAYHAYVCKQSEMKALSTEELRLFASMRMHREAQQLAVGVLCDVVAPSELFAPERVASIRQSESDLSNVPLARDALIRARYDDNPFRSEHLEWRPEATQSTGGDADGCRA